MTAGRPAKSEVKQIDSQFNPQELIKTFSNQHQTIEHKSLGEPGTRNVSARQDNCGSWEFACSVVMIYRQYH